MKIVFLGTPSFAVPILKGLHEHYEIALVISQPNRVKKKGVFLDTPVASMAKELGLPLIQPESIKDIFQEIEALHADTLITAAYGQYIPSKILNLFKVKVNVHGSLLPKHRGGAPIQRCLMEGDSITGVTIMEMAKKLDGGKIYSMEEYKIENNKNCRDGYCNITRNLNSSICLCSFCIPLRHIHNYLFPLALLCVLHNIWQFLISVLPPLLHAVTWSASISSSFQMR